VCRFVLLGIALAFLAAPIQVRADAPVESNEAVVRATLAGKSSAAVELWDLSRWRESLTALYAKRAFAPLWFTDGELTDAGAALIRQLRDVERRGLLVVDYDGERFARLAAEFESDGPQSSEALIRLDVALSVVAARLATDLHDGRIDPGAIGYDLDVPRPAFRADEAVAALARARRVSMALDALEPQLRHFLLLKQALARYRAMATDPELTKLPSPPRFSVRPGERYVGAPALRRLLRTLGDLRDPSAQSVADAPVLDPALVTGLMRFQSRHGLEADGVLGRATFRALTTPLGARVRQIVLTLERARWLPTRLESPPIFVNIPQFRLFAFRTTNDFVQDILQMDVIVGSAFKARQTPVFAADMRYVVLQPYWDVPQSILLNEQLPEIQANPGWVEENGFEIVLGQSDDAVVQPVTDRNIQLLAQGKLRLRQKPGPANALGRVKFMFPNRHNVYLHDTPARSLFRHARRAFSHGCIRVSDPMALLAHVMRDDPTWNAERLAAALQSETPVRVPLPRPIRVFIIYGTALATEAGDTLFFEDIYNQDPRLAALLASRRTRALTHSVKGAR